MGSRTTTPVTIKEQDDQPLRGLQHILRFRQPVPKYRYDDINTVDQDPNPPGTERTGEDSGNDEDICIPVNGMIRKSPLVPADSWHGQGTVNPSKRHSGSHQGSQAERHL